MINDLVPMIGIPSGSSKRKWDSIRGVSLWHWHVCFVIYDRKTQLIHQNREMRFYIVDAFSNVSFKGNPAAVVLVDKSLDESEYLEISGEFNLR